MSVTTEPCPERRKDAHQVKSGTVRNMVKPYANQDGEGIRERPKLKLEASTVLNPLCYYFEYNKGHIQKDIPGKGKINTDNWMTERVQAEECSCQWKSPLGSCCFGNVRSAISETQEELS